jgi:hypothetical protein
MQDDTSQAELSALFLAARDGSVRIFGQHHLRAFADHVAAQGEVIRNVEAYEISGELEIPRIELGLYQGSADEANQPAAVRLAASEGRLREIVEDADEKSCLFVFDVWTDEND